MGQITAAIVEKNYEVMPVKNYFNYYILVWAIAIIVFNVVVWVVPSELYGYQKTAGAFWPGYVFINLSIIGMLPCGYYVSQSKNKDRLFLSMPIMSLSFVSLVVMTAAGITCMAVPGIPAWVGIIVCIIIFGVAITSIISTNAASKMISTIDNKVKDQTLFIKSLVVDAQHLMEIAEGETAKTKTKEVYESIRYSDPVSSPALASVEAEIITQFNDFSNSVQNGNEPEMIKLSKTLQILVKERNNKCKINK